MEDNNEFIPIYSEENLQEFLSDERFELCCKRFWVEYSPEWRLQNHFEFVKADGSSCPIHNKLNFEKT